MRSGGDCTADEPLHAWAVSVKRAVLLNCRQQQKLIERLALALLALLPVLGGQLRSPPDGGTCCKLSGGGGLEGRGALVSVGVTLSTGGASVSLCASTTVGPPSLTRRDGVVASFDTGGKTEGQ